MIFYGRKTLICYSVVTAVNSESQSTKVENFDLGLNKVANNKREQGSQELLNLTCRCFGSTGCQAGVATGGAARSAARQETKSPV